MAHWRKLESKQTADTIIIWKQRAANSYSKQTADYVDSKQTACSVYSKQTADCVNSKQTADSVY